MHITQVIAGAAKPIFPHQLREDFVADHRLCELVAVVRKPPERHRRRLLDAAGRRAECQPWYGERDQLLSPKHAQPGGSGAPGHVVEQQRPQQSHDAGLLEHLDVLRHGESTGQRCFEKHRKVRKRPP